MWFGNFRSKKDQTRARDGRYGDDGVQNAYENTSFGEGVVQTYHHTRRIVESYKDILEFGWDFFDGSPYLLYCVFSSLTTQHSSITKQPPPATGQH